MLTEMTTRTLASVSNDQDAVYSKTKHTRTHTHWLLVHDFALVNDRFRFHARKQNAFRVIAIVWAAVRPSVTLLDCIKTVQASIIKPSLWAASRTLVFWWRNFVPLGEGVPSNEGVEKGYPSLKDVILPLHCVSKNIPDIFDCNLKTN